MHHQLIVLCNSSDSGHVTKSANIIGVMENRLQHLSLKKKVKSIALMVCKYLNKQIKIKMF